MNMATIAGHTFDGNDICITEKTTYVDGVAITTICGKRWLDLIHCDADCVGQGGYAHTSTLNDRELKEIMDERDRRARAYEQATRSVSGGGDYVVAKPEPPVQPDAMMCYSVACHGLKLELNPCAEVFRETSVKSANEASGYFLDRLGQMYGCWRTDAEPDSAFRQRIMASVMA